MGKTHKKKAAGPPDWEAMGDRLSPFKLSEKRYKRYAGRRVDVSAALDPRGEVSGRLTRVSGAGNAGLEGHEGGTVLGVTGREGLYILPSFISAEDQVCIH
jgi:hypothetical protein